MTKEEQRLQEVRDGKKNWRMWGPYVSERAWGTVREDYSADGNAWDNFPHDHARSRAFRWNEDGLAGICDDRQFLCFALALWNGNDASLKERLFGLTGPQGNHGEDVKECYYYLDNTPTHAYMKWLYKYPQRAFPYNQLREENRRRTREDPEFELLDTGVFDGDRYFDVMVEYAKADVEDMIIKVSATNRGPATARIDLLPTLWFRNTWAWGYDGRRPRMSATPRAEIPGGGRLDAVALTAEHHLLGTYALFCQILEKGPQWLFTENETNKARFSEGADNPSRYVKDGINDCVVAGITTAVNPAGVGTKAAAHYSLLIPRGETRTLRLRLMAGTPKGDPLGAQWDEVLAAREKEADEFYATVVPPGLSEDARNVQRQAFAGMLWNKQFYNYNLLRWLSGDPSQAEPAAARWRGRNSNWTHLNNHDVLSMPDKWEYPWYAAWDLAFHSLPLALIDPDFAKEQLILLQREWYMHPNGQLPAYEWAFGDVNPPVHAWAALRVYQIERRVRGIGDMKFLERVFHKLLINFTWWVNRKDAEGRNVFQGGFLGLDNIGVFDRDAILPSGVQLDQSDGTSWMAMYSLNMLAIALELARQDDTYEDVATKFLEHFFYIAHAMNSRPSARGDDGINLWDDEDGFYYDVLQSGSDTMFLKVRSMVGLIPLFAVMTIDADVLAKLPGFQSRLEWFLAHRPDLCENVASVTKAGKEGRRLFAVADINRLRRILHRAFDETEFLSPFGLRSLSRIHRETPYQLTLGNEPHRIDYEPAEARSGLFGGNSNWRGPVWFPLNYLMIESLQKFDYYYGSDFTIEYPTGSGRKLTLAQVTSDLSQRLVRIFLRGKEGRRPVFGGIEKFQSDPNFRDLILFHEYFHGDNGSGLGASHQTGWTGLVSKLIQQGGV